MRSKLRQSTPQSTPQNKRKRINSRRMTQRTNNSKCPRKNRLRAFPIGQTQTPRLTPSHVSQRGPPSHQEEKTRSGPHRKTLNLADIEVSPMAFIQDHWYLIAVLCRQKPQDKMWVNKWLNRNTFCKPSTGFRKMTVGSRKQLL